MKRLALCALLLFGTAGIELLAQRPTAPSPAKAQPKGPAKEGMKSALGAPAFSTNQAISTEIYADEAFFDSANHIGIFSGHVIVKDPRFNLQAEKLTIYLNKGAMNPEGKTESAPPEIGEAKSPAQALEKAVAEGNVGLVHERPGENGGPPVRTVGRADMAVYTAGDGNVELRGTPRVQSGSNTHAATSPDTIMVINQSGQLTTHGPSRTEIRQEAKPDASKPAPAKP